MRNLYNFVEAFFDREAKKAVFDRNDEIIQEVQLTYKGAIIYRVCSSKDFIKEVGGLKNQQQKKPVAEASGKETCSQKTSKAESRSQ